MSFEEEELWNEMVDHEMVDDEMKKMGDWKRKKKIRKRRNQKYYINYDINIVYFFTISFSHIFHIMNHDLISPHDVISYFVFRKNLRLILFHVWSFLFIKNKTNIDIDSRTWAVQYWYRNQNINFSEKIISISHHHLLQSTIYHLPSHLISHR